MNEAEATDHPSASRFIKYRPLSSTLSNLIYSSFFSNHQYQDLKSPEKQIHPLVIPVGSITRRCYAEFSGDFHHR